MTTQRRVVNPGAPAGASVARVQPMATNPPAVVPRAEGSGRSRRTSISTGSGERFAASRVVTKSPARESCPMTLKLHPRPVRVAVERPRVGARGLDRNRPRRENAKPGRGQVEPRGVADERDRPVARICGRGLRRRDGVGFGPGDAHLERLRRFRPAPATASTSRSTNSPVRSRRTRNRRAANGSVASQ